MSRQILPEKKDAIDNGRVQEKISYQNKMACLEIFNKNKMFFLLKTTK